MTQAFNLSQLANGVNTLGQLNAAANLYNQVPVANGGTNASSFAGNAAIISNAGGTALSSVAAGANGNVLTSNGTTWTSAANVAGTGINTVTTATSSGTWTKPATVKTIKVTVVGGGGGGGGNNSNVGASGGGGGTSIRWYPAASIPGPQPYTVGGGGTGGTGGTAPFDASAGGTSSFGVAPITVISATGGSGGLGNTGRYGVGANGGTGSNGNLNIPGSAATPNWNINISPASDGATGNGGGTFLSGMNLAGLRGSGGTATGIGQGGFGSSSPTINPGGQNGGTGIVIIEEFY